MSAFGIEFLDQTGQGIAVLPDEEGSDRASAKLSDKAVLRAGAFAVNIERMKRRGAFADGKFDAKGVAKVLADLPKILPK